MLFGQKNEKEISSLGVESYIALLAIICITLHLAFQYALPKFQAYALYPLYITLALGGSLLVLELIRNLINFQFGSDLLAGISIIASILLGEYLAGSLVVLMLSGGQTIESYAIRSASKMLEVLAKRSPTIAHRKKNEAIEDIPVEKIAIGDTLLIFPHEICPVDGEVTSGNGVMDESYLTGEPFLISKAPGSEVLSGSINGEASLTIKSTKLAQDSRYAKIMQVMSETEQKRPQMRRLADQLGAWYTPLAIIIAILAWVISGDAVRFLAVLVIATPCPLLIAIPVAIIGSISLCAKRGILIKNPIVLEQIDQCKTMIFDKTGTLTYGKPSLTDQTVYNNFDPKEILKLVASIERYSKHPLASAILDKAGEENIKLLDVQQISEPKGSGLLATVDKHEVLITSRKLLTKMGLERDVSLLPQGAGLECVILIDGKLAAHYRFRDSPRSESKSFIHHLFPKHGIKKVMIISGDREEEVKYLANYVGITEVYAGKSPEEKVELVVEETEKAKTAYLGDGINDAPALLAATVGIAFGRSSDITADAAGAVVMDNSLKTVDEFMHISKRMRAIALESALGGMALSVLGMIIAAFGFLPPVAGAISQEVIDVFAILNSLRTIWMPTKISDM
ncbi:heavy metal translocating P-type ATPase [Criblamydia sequanensis]|uniref:P-type Zn(2+) transporter n=1 Tax=Candidatus Criblamydia sequanensis CRIB-18 TaxID=1437425 RepID=A0A090D046_9BACT|nr:heavy metal translocating P-type ATPase [Criblamydia sequanensis]CDR34842.1 Cadmium-translocating P-type ATPase [Criblamydia sequanensis CRIB-18]